jgi:hypothetical protein
MAKTPIVHAQQRWEYLTVIRRSEKYLTDELNDVGQKGWELVSILYDRDAKGELFWGGFLKRPATQQAQPAAQQKPAAEAQAPREAQEAELADVSERFDLSGDEFQIREESAGAGGGPDRGGAEAEPKEE